MNSGRFFQKDDQGFFFSGLCIRPQCSVVFQGTAVLLDSEARICFPTASLKDNYILSSHFRVSFEESLANDSANTPQAH